MGDVEVRVLLLDLVIDSVSSVAVYCADFGPFRCHT